MFSSLQLLDYSLFILISKCIHRIFETSKYLPKNKRIVLYSTAIFCIFFFRYARQPNPEQYRPNSEPAVYEKDELDYDEESGNTIPGYY